MCVTKAEASPDSSKFPTLDVLEIFKRNQNNIPDLRWQYFATEDGIMINYPSTSSGFSDCTSYDPRFRPFYVSTAMQTPKDIVVVMDTSDSMQGTLSGKVLLKIAKEAAITVIKTLNPIDRVGFVAFNDEAETPSSVDSCFSNTLALVTSENVEKLKNFINNRPASGNTNYEKALRAAFTFFNQSTPSLRGESRDKVILFLTDGNPTEGKDPMEVIKELNEPLNNNVVIHTFGLSTSVREDLLTNMSRQTLNDRAYGEIKVGRFERITDADRLRTAMATYYQYFAYTGSSSPVFTPPYIDLFSDIGIILSVCLPVYHSGSFIGVTCTDIELGNLLSDITYLSESESSYMFMIDGYGRTLVHPLLPIHQSELPDVVDIQYFERATGVTNVLESMVNQGNGTTTLATKIVQQRGEMIREGDEVRDISARYVWSNVQNSNYSICFVIKIGEKQTTLPSGVPSDDVFVYHNRLVRPGPYKNCAHFSRWATKDRSGVMLTPSAFEEPYKYLDETETESKIAAYERYLRGEVLTNPGFKSSVINSVVATYPLEDLWKRNNFEAPYIVWRYITTIDGIVRMYPLVQMRKDYDHKLRPWYQRTLAHKGTLSVSMPYMDLWGSGLVITLSKAILQGRLNGVHSISADSTVAVMGTDFPLYYFDQILRSKFKECRETRTYSCIVIDSSGFVVMHPDFIETTDNPNLDDPVHITSKSTNVPDETECVGTTCDCLCYVNINFKQCENKYPDGDCFSVAGCSWCTERFDGSTLDGESFCDLQETCPYRKCTQSADCKSKCQVAGPPDQSESNTTVIIVVCVVIVLIIIVVVVIVVILKCRLVKKDPDDTYLDAIDDKYFDRPIDGQQNIVFDHRSLSVSSNSQSASGQPNVVFNNRSMSVTSNMSTRSPHPLPGQSQIHQVRLNSDYHLPTDNYSSQGSNASNQIHTSSNGTRNQNVLYDTPVSEESASSDDLKNKRMTYENPVNSEQTTINPNQNEQLSNNSVPHGNYVNNEHIDSAPTPHSHDDGYISPSLDHDNTQENSYISSRGSADSHRYDTLNSESI
ncbi:hypothetical protein FSP39_011482 [Pinctada imbricata]|uniref:VWFA domain-containing protein n=1 Tax=Pinctada imbricata TaxID=66713 RepID=A0AA89BR12_PINIB|nr:hypothetical protein FSP39_011482 [Pinctada imbricata]